MLWSVSSEIRLVVANAAVCELLSANSVLLHELSTLREVFGIVRAGEFSPLLISLLDGEPLDSLLLKLPVEVENLLSRRLSGLGDVFGQVALWRSMALKTPSHLEGVAFPGDLHLIDRAMADIAIQASGNMDAVIEENELGHLVDQVPLDRRIRFIALANRLQHRTVGPNLGMARHTGFSRRQSGIAGFFNRRMAVPTVDSQLPCVVLMAKRHRLIQRHVLLGVGRRTGQAGNRKPHGWHSYDKADET